MKINLLLLSFILLAACSAEVKSEGGPEFPPLPGPPNSGNNSNNTSAQQVGETFVSDCQNQGGMSYQVIAHIAANSTQVLQRTYTSVPGCMDYTKSANVQESDITTDVQVQRAADGNSVQVKASGVSIMATKIEARTYTDERGLYAYYEGTASDAGVEKPVSNFSQVVRKGDGVNNFTYIWTFVNVKVENPASNAWVYSGSKTSENYKKTMSDCKNIQMIKVKAGFFKTCLVETKSEKIWYGNVPIHGIVKYERLKSKEYIPTPFFFMAFRAGLPGDSAFKVELSAVGY